MRNARKKDHISSFLVYFRKHLQKYRYVAIITVILVFLSILLAPFYIFISYQKVIKYAEKKHCQFFLDTAKSLSREAQRHKELPDRESLRHVLNEWKATMRDRRKADEYLCIINADGKFILNTLYSENIDGNTMLNGSPQSCRRLRDILKKQGNYYADEYILRSGEAQIAVFSFVPIRNWIIGIYCSKSAIEAEARAGLQPLYLTLIVVSGILTPILLLLTAFHLFHWRRRFIEQANKENRRKFSTLLSHLKGMAYRCLNDDDWTMEFISEASLAITGYSPEDLTQNKGKSYNDLIHPDDQKMVKTQVQKAVSLPEPFQVKYRIKDKSGNEKWMFEEGSGVFSESGKLLALEGYITDITDWERATREAARISDKLNEAQESAHIGSWDWDMRTSEVWWSEETYRIFERDPLAYVPTIEDSMNFYHPDDIDKFIDLLTHALDRKRLFTVDVRLITESGTKDCCMDGKCLYDNSGKQVRMIGTIRDITEQKKVERALQQSENRYRMLFDKMLEGVVLYQIINNDKGEPADFLFLSANPAFEKMTGLKGKDMRGQSLHCLEHKDCIYSDAQNASIKFNLKTWQSRHRDNFLLHTPFKYEKSLEKSGKYFAIQAFFPEPGVLACIYEDIAKRKKYETEILKYKTIFDTANFGLGIFDLSGRLLIVNEYFAKVHGYMIEELTGQPIAFFHTLEQLDKMQELILKVKAVGFFSMEEVGHTTKSGKSFPMLMNGRLVKDNKGKPLYIAATGLDITEQKMAKLEAERHKEQLIQADKMVSLGVLVAGVAHEINNPNNSIMLNLPIIQNIVEYALPELDRKFAKNGDFKIGNIPYSELKKEIANLFVGVSESAIRIKEIVKDLKDYSRDASSEEHNEMDLNKIVMSAWNLLKNMTKKSLAGHRLDLEKCIPSVLGNFQKIEQVVINVIQNACQSDPERKVNLEICSFYEKKIDMVCLTITDDGNGIPKDSMKHITDPFFTTKRKSGGTGLGLSVSLGIIKKHNAEINFDSVEGKGTAVTIKIPAIKRG